MRTLFALFSIGLLIMVIVAAFLNINPEWKGFQERYLELALERTTDEVTREALKETPVRIEQTYLPELDRIDRCVSCHLGVENSIMKDVPEPFRVHPGNYLEFHPINRFGCTICHEGQGRATSLQEAHANSEPFWERPLLISDFVQASCLKCHSGEIPQSAQVLLRGGLLVDEKGCMGCHMVSGKGGILGPDLTSIGIANKHVKHASRKNRAKLLARVFGNETLAFIWEAVQYPKDWPEGESGMIDYGLSDEEALALTVYLKGCTGESVPSQLLPRTYNPSKPSGSKLYQKFCSVCHGPKGEGTDLPELRIMGPAIGNKDFLAIATRSLLKRLIDTGKNTAIMPSWTNTGGLWPDEVDAIVDHLKSWQGTIIPWEEFSQLQGDPAEGKSIFDLRCSACHGLEGKVEAGVFGPSLNNPSFMSSVSDRFLYETIVNGRPETAMPSWKHLSREDLANLLAYILQWRPEVPSLNAVVKSSWVPNASQQGARLYRQYCAGCHGLDGEGGIGPNLNNPNFLRLASDDFLYRTIAEGRPGTAMGAYSYLGAAKLGQILAYLRGWRTLPLLTLTNETVEGSEFRGEKVYAEHCARCHGDSGEGGIAPALFNPAFLSVVSDSYIKQTIVLGRTGTRMPTFGLIKHEAESLTHREIADVVAFIRSRQLVPGGLAEKRRVEGDASIGKILYERNCSQCHGPEGEGGTGPSLSNPGFLSVASDGFIQAIIVNGREGTEMKAFGVGSDNPVQLSWQDVNNVTAFIRSWERREKVFWRYVQGDPEAGRRLYKENCSDCHGEKARNVLTPTLNDAVFLSAVSDGYLQATIVMGRHDTMMGSFARGGEGMAELTPQEINDIIVFLRSLPGEAKKN